jgi:hypothetical protein
MNVWKNGGFSSLHILIKKIKLENHTPFLTNLASEQKKPR